jgi:hypothetical protein
MSIIFVVFTLDHRLMWLYQLYTNSGVVLLHGTRDAVKQRRDQHRGQMWNLYSLGILC